MASSMMISSATATVARSTAPAQAAVVAPYTGLKSAAGLPTAGRKATTNLNHLPSNGSRVQCMQVWPIEGKKKFETLSYLPQLTTEQLLKQIEYLLRSRWIPCLEFCKIGHTHREHHRSSIYHWTMWKQPMFGCTDATQLLKELEELKNAYPDAVARITAFNNDRQVQGINFIAYKPPSKEDNP